MRKVIIHYCEIAGCQCLDRNGVIAYDGFDSAEAEYWLINVSCGYVARDESAKYA